MTFNLADEGETDHFFVFKGVDGQRYDSLLLPWDCFFFLGNFFMFGENTVLQCKALIKDRCVVC